MIQPALSHEEPFTDSQKAMLEDAIVGLSKEQKQIPSKYFYDEEGSRIFDEITELPEYYPTRTEAEIMQQSAGEMASSLGSGVLLVEYGSGSSVKTRALLDCMPDLAGYVPVDISGDYLEQVASQLQTDYPYIEVKHMVADFTEPFQLPPLKDAHQRIIAYFPGSTIGNFDRADAARILSQMASLAGENGGVLIGVDLLKPIPVLLDAYNDSQGVTARFNMNLLHRLNNELGADFNTEQFRHRSIFNSAESRIEMHLLSQRPQSVCLEGVRFHFQEGESILTEYSHKYSLEDFAELAATAGLEPEQIWTDDNALFSVQYLVPA